MLILAMIPLVALAAAAALGLSIRRQFQHSVARIRADAERQRREALDADAANDASLPAALVLAKHPPAKCLEDYNAGRAAIASAAGVDPTPSWTPESLDRGLTTRMRRAASELRRQLLVRAAAWALAITVAAGAAAALRYHLISQSGSSPTANTSALADLPNDPFATAPPSASP